MRHRTFNLCLLLGTIMSVERSDADWQQFDPSEATTLIDQLPIEADATDFVRLNDDGTVTITAPVGQSASVPLGVFSIDGMKSRAYALQLLVDHDISGSPAHFEMWTSLEPGGQFFSKTLATVGPSAHLAGSATERDVLIPASLAGSTATATECSLGLVLPSGGTVTVRKARMLDLPDALAYASSVAGQWFPAWFGGVLGGVFGIAAGCLGAFFAYSHRTGFGWQAMQHFPITLGAFCGCILATGIVALAVKQPYHVWYPLVLLGVLGVVLAPTIRWQTERQFPKHASAFEDRQMQAMDA